MKDKIMDELLAPIIERANKCIDSELLFTVEEDEHEPWKVAFLVFIAAKSLLLLSGTLHERMILKDKEAIKIKYKSLPE